MRHPVRRARYRTRALAVAAAAVVAAGACSNGGSGAAGSAPQPGEVDLRGGSIAAETDLSGASLTVSSKEFTESEVLGKITIYALRAAGAEARDQTGLMGSNIVRTALENGDIDLYWEYSGTGWTQYLAEKEAIQDPQEQFRATAESDGKRNGIAWMGPARFGNQYAIARAGDAPPPVRQVDSLGDLSEFVRENPDEATFCGAAEFMDRRWADFQHVYDAPFPASGAYQMDLALNYVNGAKGDPCNFAEVFTTDARIESLDMQVLDDPQGFFTTELAALTARGETVEEHPELRRLAEQLGGALTEEAIIELNGMVDLDGASTDEAALHFLRENGFIG